MTADPEIAREILDALWGYYGDLNWWPAQTPYEVIIGAILTQNTAWRNVELALDRLKGRMTPEAILSLSIPELEDAIRPAGFYHQKAQYLLTVTRWFAAHQKRSPEGSERSLKKLREELLSLRGVGPETADTILLYALEKPSFVVDAYTKRLTLRFPLLPAASYTALKEYFEKSLPREVSLYNQFHALIVVHAKTHCKVKPLCRGCPLERRCEKRLTPQSPK
ncbi:Endonuclease III [Clostridiaceae bacterium JG1575]|nr:Endonuclease III [Clostridiaceae bacterium JG1575]